MIGELKIGAGGLFTVADAVACEQVKLNAQFWVAVTVTPVLGIGPNLITAVSNWVPVFATIVAPAGKTQLMGDVLIVDVATNFNCVLGHALAVSGEIVKTGLGATTIKVDNGELQTVGSVAVMV